MKNASKKNEEKSSKIRFDKKQIIEKIDNLLQNYKFSDLLLEEWEMGIDEAGRGPVLGPMVYACCFWPTKLKAELQELGFADSKQLSEAERDFLFENLNRLNLNCLSYKTNCLDPEYISNSMLQKCKLNLNKMSHDTAIGLINKVLANNYNVTEVFIDTVGSPKTYEEKLYSEFKFKYPNLNFTVSEKADSKFPVVSAASICAKVTRDNELKKWHENNKKVQINSIDFGSGYPGDPVTLKWLADNRDRVFGYPNIVRYSWKTIENLLEKECVKFEFADEDDSNENSHSISGFFTKKNPYMINHLKLTDNFSL